MIKQIRVTVDGKPYDVTVEIPDDAPPPAASAPPPPATGAPVAAPSPAPSPAPAAPAPAAAAAGDIPSPLSGHVVGVAVTLGQAIKKGDSLLTVEAMKMNTFVLAPSDGKVAAIHVKTGDLVTEGQPVMRIE